MDEDFYDIKYKKLVVWKIYFYIGLILFPLFLYILVDNVVCILQDISLIYVIKFSIPLIYSLLKLHKEDKFCYTFFNNKLCEFRKPLFSFVLFSFIICYIISIYNNYYIWYYYLLIFIICINVYNFHINLNYEEYIKLRNDNNKVNIINKWKNFKYNCIMFL